MSNFSAEIGTIRDSLDIDSISRGKFVRKEILDPRAPIVYVASVVDEDTMRALRVQERQRNVMLEYFEHAPTLPDPLPDPPHDLHLDYITGPMSDRALLGIRNAVTRNIMLRGLIDIMVRRCGTRHRAIHAYIDDLVDLDETIGHHLVPTFTELITRAGRRSLKYTYQFFVARYPPQNEADVEKALDIAMRSEFVDIVKYDIPSVLHACYPRLFHKYPVFMEVPIRYIEMTYYGAITPFDSDGFDDTLARDEGWTSENCDFARTQLLSGGSHEFREYLIQRRDFPPFVKYNITS